ncbi:DUF167 domain-containing protein [Kamptonema cortianum]|nr:DUF167 domain-containing protein [Geitlerinema splendidum]MDK3155983.1 DUF167 domain-containing protein [Kamptonema cortianum]
MVALNVKVIPLAARNELVVLSDRELRIRVSAPPADGEANRAVIESIASFVGIAKTRVQISRGETGRNKVVALDCDIADFLLACDRGRY